MPNILCAIYATQIQPNRIDQTLIATAHIYDGDKPCSQIIIRDRIFNFVADPQYLLEETLWQLQTYTQIPFADYSFDVNNNLPDLLENEYEEDDIKEGRCNLVSDLKAGSLSYSMIAWPGMDLYEPAIVIDTLKNAGANITIHQIKLN